MNNRELQEELKSKNKNLDVSITDYWLTSKFGEILTETGANNCTTNYLKIEKKDNILILKHEDEVNQRNISNILPELKKYDDDLEIYIRNNLNNRLERLNKVLNVEDINGIEGIRLSTFNEDKNFFIIKHYYSIDIETDSLLVESEIEADELIRIITAIVLKFEDLFDESTSVEFKEILEILEKFKYVENIKFKNETLTESIKRNIEDETYAFVIDTYYSREMYCSDPNVVYRSIKDNEKEIEEMILGYKEKYSKH